MAPLEKNLGNSSIGEKLIFDIGFHNGDDSAYYLSHGHRVLAVEANPVMVEEGRRRFQNEIANGRLTLVNRGLWNESGSKLTFYVNDTDSGWSSFVKGIGQRDGKFHEVQVDCITPAELFQKYGVPWYLKVDIEGSDKIVVGSLTKQNAPQYFSSELGHNSPALELLVRCGYTAFKLINQVTFTQSLPIFDNQLGIRALRKLSVKFPGFGKAIAGLPDSIRPKYILWDTFRDKIPYTFSRYSTGPYAEETEGKWQTADQIRPKISRLFQLYSRLGIENDFWFDLHARLG
jgi:FkbM family methyltransferase